MPNTNTNTMPRLQAVRREASVGACLSFFLANVSFVLPLKECSSLEVFASQERREASSTNAAASENGSLKINEFAVCNLRGNKGLLSEKERLGV